MDVSLYELQDERDAAIGLIRKFWKEHNGYNQSEQEAAQDLDSWTREGHRFYLIVCDGKFVGFAHLGSRGGEADWLEDIFVASSWQNRGIGTRAIQLVEEIVKTYSESLYMEAAARNERAICLYRRLGYNCLNTITIRKDFAPERHTVIRTETIYGQDFEIKKMNQ